ncbi:MAG: hypothetical protein A2046_00140 [Bacteroidetes bacterium GWA2_30_7]|nr:MAG: hypothetical protein A2046_00140 [Bacteroidetes bacterium GWA2_30_7]
MNQLKKLAGQTAVYGLGTIVPRVLNYLLLTPFYTYLFVESKYGVITELYAYVAFLLVLLTYGMETTYFRFSESEQNKDKVYSNALISVFFTSILFVLFAVIFRQPLASAILYPKNPEYIVWLAVIVSLDAVTAIPFAKLRKQNQAGRFVMIKIVNVVINIVLNLFFFVLCPKLIAENKDSIVAIVYSKKIGVGYAFISNIVASAISLLILLPELTKIKLKIDKALLKKMLSYTFPLLIVGIAGMVNEVADKIFLKYLVTIPETVKDKSAYVLAQIGIYGANYKIAVLMSIFIQMFRFAAEPFFFAQAKEKNSNKTYADVMKYFIIFGLLIFLGVMLFMDIFQVFIGPAYRVGLHIVPIVLLANLFLGISFNLSIWYKLNNMTKYGAVISILSAIITIILNIVLIPSYGYTGSAWATFLCYLFMMLFSYFLGQKFYPVKYEIKRIAIYFIVAIIFYVIHEFLKFNQVFNYISSFLLMGIFFYLIYYFEIQQRHIISTNESV